MRHVQLGQTTIAFIPRDPQSTAVKVVTRGIRLRTADRHFHLIAPHLLTVDRVGVGLGENRRAFTVERRVVHHDRHRFAFGRIKDFERDIFQMAARRGLRAGRCPAFLVGLNLVTREQTRFTVNL